MLTRKDPIIQGMASALWVTAYAEAVEDADLQAEYGPGPGGDWLDATPPAPDEAEDYALVLSGMFATKNRMSMEALVAKAFREDGLSLQDEDKVENFGFYLAMRALGHGISWEDNHADAGIKYPHIESELFPQAEEMLGVY